MTMEYVLDLANVRSMVTVNFLTEFVASLLFLSVLCCGKVERHTGPLKVLISANVVGSVGFALLLWDVAPEDFPQRVVIANLSLDVGIALILVAMNEFFGCSWRRAWPIAPAALIVLVEISMAVIWTQMPEWLMVQMGCLARGILAVATGVTLVVAAPLTLRGPARLTAAFHFMWAFMLIIRIIAAAIGGSDDTALQVSSVVGLMVRFLLTWIIAICLLWMIVRQLDEQIIKFATLDELTGLLNRRVIWETGLRRANRARNSGNNLSAIILDIDHFKNINDSFGHAAGDIVLRSVGRCLVDCIGDNDVVGRIGGEEFLVLPANDQVSNSRVIAENIRDCIASLVIILEKNVQIQCTVSVGCAVSTAETNDWGALVATADAALYAAKRAGRNRVIDAACRPVIDGI